MPQHPTRATTPTVRDKDLQPRATGLTREQCAEVHAIRRLVERYSHLGVTIETAAATMMDHLALVLAGESERRMIEGRAYHRGNEIHRLWYGDEPIYLAFDPSIMRIVTYLPPNRRVEKLARPKIRRSSHRR